MSDTPRSDDFIGPITGIYMTEGEIAMCDFARELERELNAAKAGRCDWKEDEDGNWNTSCNQCMVFEYAPPHEQGYKFCHHCGKPINFIKFTFIEEQP